MKRGIIICTLLSILSAVAIPREWTSSSGQKLQAAFVSTANGEVTLKRDSDGKTFTLPLDRLSQTDQDWIKEQSNKPAKPIEGPYAKFLTGDWELSKLGDLPYAIYGAKELDGSKKYPLLLALHGKSQNNENGKQVHRWMKSFTEPERYQKNPCIIAAPLCYQPYGGTGGGWSDKPGEEAIDLVKELSKNLPVDEDRIYIFGYSMGGFGTCHLIDSEPRLFAAGIAGAGCTSPSTAGSFKKVPLWLFHAVDDPTVDVKYSRDLAEALKRNKDCKYTEYPDGKHGIAGRIFESDETHTWLFSHKR